MLSTILITGATGTVGESVVQQLQQQKISCRVAVRQPERARSLFGKADNQADNQAGNQPDSQIEAVRFDFLDPTTFEAALAGITHLFLVRPPALSHLQQIAPVLAAAKAANVQQVVFLSIMGADRNRVVPHAAIEQRIQQLGLPFTFLRAGFFMQNLSTTHCDDIRLRDELFLPAGTGKTSFIDARDIATVAVLALTQPGHTFQAYSLTGKAALNYFEVAEILTEVLDRPICYSHPNLLKFIWTMRRRGLPLKFVLVMAGIYTTTRCGWAESIAPDLERLLGRPPLSLRQFVEDYRAVWQR